MSMLRPCNKSSSLWSGQMKAPILSHTTDSAQLEPLGTRCERYLLGLLGPPRLLLGLVFHHFLQLWRGHDAVGGLVCRVSYDQKKNKGKCSVVLSWRRGEKGKVEIQTLA